jgi:glycosyltransferase involved in cell wall biosynthesis
MHVVYSADVGNRVLNKSLTIVLPVHNAENRLRKNVSELLDLASELTSKFGVLIIDDGSTDSTFEVAAELAAHYPQVSVRRHRQTRGLGASIDYAQNRVRSDAVILHDGVTPINSQEVRKLWHQWLDGSKTRSDYGQVAMRAGLTSDFANVSAVHRGMERAHQRLRGFQLLPAMQYDDSGFDFPVRRREKQAGSTRDARQAGVGRIPSLPRPKFLSALTDFALGE